MATLTSQLIISLLDKVTGPARGIAGAVNTLRSRIEANNRQLDAMRGRMAEATAVAYGLYRAIRAPVQSALEFESAMADVRKVVDFPTPQAFKQMSSDIIALSTRIPIAATGIADIVAAAGQAGMAGDELLAFTEVAAKVGVAFDMSAGEVGEALAKIKTQLQISVADTSALADAINHLSNTSASSAPALVNYMKRVAAVGEQYGFTAVQTAAIGSAMIATGAEAEVAATSFRNIGRALSKGTAASKQQRQAFKALGLDAVEVSKRLQQDAVGTLRDVILKIRALPEHMQASVMSQLFGDEARALAPLINQVDILDQALANVADSATYLGSSQKEFEARSATTANAMQLFGNKMEALGIAIGSALLPAINDLMDALGPVVLAMARFAETNPRLTRGIVGLVAGLVALRLAALAAQFAFLWLKGGVLTAALGIVQSAGLIGRAGLAIRAALTGWGSIAAGLGFTSAFSMFGSILAALPGMALSAVTGVVGAFAGMTAPIWGTIAAVIAAVASLALAVYNYWEPISNFVSGFASAIGAALSSLVSEMIAFGSRIAGAIGSWASQKVFDLAAWLGIDQETVQKAVALVVGVMQNLKSTIVSAVKAIPAEIGNWFSDIFTMNDYSDEAEAEFRSMGERAAQGLIDAIAAVPGQIGTLIGSIDFAAMGAALQQRLTEAVAAARAKLDELVAFLSALPERIRAIFASIDLAAAGRALMNSLLEGIKAGAQAVLDYVSNIGSRIRSSIAGAASSAWSGVKSAVGMGGGETVEKRAAGGPVDALRPYLVGERGPELFMPAVHGTIMNAQKTASMLNGLRSNIVVPEPPRPIAASRAGRAAAGGPTSISFGNIIIQGGSGASAEQLRREFGREASAIMRSHFSDGGT